MTSPIDQAARGTNARPLRGKRLFLTRPSAQAGDFAARVAALGGDAVLAPAIAIVPPERWTAADAALRRVGTYDWIAFTSANAVRAVVDRVDALGISRDVLRGCQLAAVGSATAASIASHLRSPDVLPSRATSETLGRELPDVHGARILLPRGDLADDALPQTLATRGAFVDNVVVYRTVPGEGIATILDALQTSSVDVLLFTSASAVRAVANAIRRAEDVPGELMRERLLVACVGPVTAAAARSVGFSRVIVAGGASVNDLIDVLGRWYSSEGFC